MPSDVRLTPVFSEGLDQAGFSLASTGPWLFVGMPQDSSPGPINTGAVATFKLNAGGQWTEGPTLASFDAYPDQYFGLTLDADATTLMVGIPQDSRFALGGGYVEVFERSGDDWIFNQSLFTNTPIAQGDKFGQSLALLGDRVLVGSPAAEANGLYSGRVTIFERTGGAWVPQAELARGDAEDLYGWSVGLGDGFAAVGTFNIEGNVFTYEGRGIVDVYEPGAGGWSLVATLQQDVPKNNERFGWCLDAAQSTIVVGAYNEGSKGGFFNGAGAAYVFERIGGTWTKSARLVAPDGGFEDQFGYSVAITPDAQTIAVGAYVDNEVGEQAGAVYVFERVAGAWTFTGKRVAPVSVVSPDIDRLGSSVALVSTPDARWAIGGAPTANAKGATSGDVYASNLDGSCAADCDASGTLTIDDFICFQTRYVLADPRADCDGSGSLNIDDFVCFQTFFVLGC